MTLFVRTFLSGLFCPDHGQLAMGSVFLMTKISEIPVASPRSETGPFGPDKSVLSKVHT